jgi:hypothetical protein
MAYSRFFTEAVSTPGLVARKRPPFFQHRSVAALLSFARAADRPTTFFVLLSLLCGAVICFTVPPLRGPDEIAHFLRIHSYAQGHLIPPASVADRKGIFVDHDLHRELAFFKAAGEWFAQSRQDGLRYGQIMQMHQQRSGTARSEIPKEAVFMPFAGSEGYSPAAYIPYIVGEKIAGWLRLEFPSRLILIRLIGLIAFTSVAAYAIRIVPFLKWQFVLVALLPVSLYNRSVLSADGAALCTALVVTALCCWAVSQLGKGRIWERSCWVTVCALTKQPQIVFVAMELMTGPLTARWKQRALVLVPSLLLSPLWVIAVSGEMGAWRLQIEEQHPPEHFDPIWKLWYMWDHPWHFPLATWNAMSAWGDRLWWELIGIVGWQDIVLQPWIYVGLTISLIVASFQKLNLAGSTRIRIAAVTAIVVMGYITLVYLIFFLTYTPLNIDHVRGVQGRYFVVTLPSFAICLAALVNVNLRFSISIVVAAIGSILSCIATADALVRAHWYS